MFIFLTNDKPVIKIVRYGIILLVFMFLCFCYYDKNKKYLFLILINLKLIQNLKYCVRYAGSYAKIYLTYIMPNIKN